MSDTEHQPRSRAGRPDGSDRPGSGDALTPHELERRRVQVVAALDRLARGVFARCDICGTEIDDERLRIAPEANRCPTHSPTDSTASSDTTRRPEAGATPMATNPSRDHLRDQAVDQPLNDVADQQTPADPYDPSDPYEIAAALAERDQEANPADVADQQRVEPYDDDEPFRG